MRMMVIVDDVLLVKVVELIGVKEKLMFLCEGL